LGIENWHFVPVFLFLINMRKFRLYLRVLTTVFLFITFSMCNEDTVDPVFYGSINGMVTYEDNDQIASGVEIYTIPTTSSVFTDSLGSYFLENVPTGNFTVVAVLEGYKVSSKSVAVNKNVSSQVDLKLVREAISPDQPQLVYPTNNEDSVERNVTLKWSVQNKTNDDLIFDIIIYEGNQDDPFLKIENQDDSVLVLSNLSFNTKYYWQVKVRNSAEMETLGEMWSFKTFPFPDNRFLFTSNRDGNYEVFSSDSLSNNLIQLTNTNGVNIFPQYSHDRKMIAYTSSVDLEYQIISMKNNGDDANQVTTLPVAGYHGQGKGFCWSPDNGKILYSHYDKLYSIDKSGSNLTLISTAPAGRHFRGCDWTTFNNRAVVETIGVLPYDNEIVLVDMANGNKTTVIGNLPGIIQSPSFSIDGKKIVYTKDVSEFESLDGRQLDSRIFVYDIATGLSTDISSNKPAGTNDLNPKFSPTGAYVIFENSSNDNTGPSSIWILEVLGGSRKQLFDNAIMPDWK